MSSREKVLFDLMITINKTRCIKNNFAMKHSKWAKANAMNILIMETFFLSRDTNKFAFMKS